MSKTEELAGVEISSPDKILFPKSGITKLQLAEYYALVSGYILPHLYNRPISMQRFPNGIAKPGFYQKERSENFPDFVKPVRVKLKTEGSKTYILVNNTKTLVFLANQSNIPIHTWLSQKGNINKPNVIIWDLDPNDSDFEKVREGAFLMRDFFKETANIEPFIKTTGSRGLHIVIPIKPENTFLKVRKLAKKLADELAHKHPKLFTTVMLKKDRGKKVFVDYLRNGFAQTAVSPYSVRPKEGAPVAMPIYWKQLEGNDLNAQHYTIENALAHLKKHGDIWKDMYKKPYKLEDLHI
ncbi:MAG: non-homologous end-joining DNA ligase [Bacteroidia bacterium]